MIYRIINETVRNNLIEEIRRLPLGVFQASISELKRSNQQNALYWKWVSIIAEAKGYDAEEFHDACKREFIGAIQGKDMFGNLYIKPKSSAKLKKSEFSAYMNKVQAYAHSEGINLPQPGYFGLDNY